MLWGVNQAWAGILSASLACCVTSGRRSPSLGLLGLLSSGRTHTAHAVL